MRTGNTGSGRWAARMLTALVLSGGIAAMAADLTDGNAVYRIDDASGRITAVLPAGSDKPVVTGIENRYTLLAESEDEFGLESQDKVEKKSEKDGVLTYECYNSEISDFRIIKRYWLAEGGLRRELTFIDDGEEPRFIQPCTESHFAPEFMKASYWFGMGYCGPYLPAPKVRKPTIVNEYVQSSKGMALCNNDFQLGSFCHYRVKLNDVIVWPWHHSSIGRYREKEDRLYYLPDGWRMCLGTFDPKPGDAKGFRVTDQFNFFHGDVFNFFSDVWGKDSEFQKELNSIPAGPEWCNDVIVMGNREGNGTLRYWGQMFDEGYLWFSFNTTAWGDYRASELDGMYPRLRGGRSTLQEMRDEVALYRSIAAPSRVKCDKYHITVAAASDTQVFREHPEWFRCTDRDGNRENLFPGDFADNYQFIADTPACREFIVNNIFDDGIRLGLDAINIDEAQQQNTIDWEKKRIVRDDHIATMWKMIRAKSIETGIAVSMNGSGNPYADLNAMEASWQIRPEQWRRMCGTALGLELFTQFRKNPIYLLYWWPVQKGDYVNRNLSLGWIPVPEKVETSSAPAIRAIYECGKTLPLAASYTPDWKKDFKCEFESYSVRRAKDRSALLSFIQRKQGVSDMQLDLTLDLATLGFAPEERINLYYSALDTYPKYVLADRELKRGYQEAHWVTPGVAHPQLLYSGPAKGTFQFKTGDVATGSMVQFLALPAGPALFAVNDLPLNWPLMATRHVKLEKDTVTGEKPVTLLFCDRDCTFTDVTVDGAPAVTRPWTFGDVPCLLADVPAGTHKVAWKSAPRPAAKSAAAFTAGQRADGKAIEITGGEPGAVYAVERNGFTFAAGPAPLALPTYYERGDYTVRDLATGATAPVKLTSGKVSKVKHRNFPKRPAKTEIKDVNVDAKGLHVSKTLTWVSSGTVLRWESLPTMDSVITEVDPEKLTITAGTTRKDDTMDTCEYAGLEFSGAKTLRLAFRNTFYNATSYRGPGFHFYGSGNPTRDFTGFVVDFHTKDGYTKRVTYSVGVFDPRMRSNTAPWGRNAIADLAVDLGDLIGQQETVFTMDLAKWAPQDWDGKVIFAIGNNFILANRRLMVEILEVNPEKPTDVLGGSTAEELMVERKMPPPIEMVKLSGDVGMPNHWQESQWKKWTKTTTDMIYYPETASPKVSQPSCGYFSYDEHGINFAIEGTETERKKLIVDRGTPWRGDEIELYFVRPDGSTLQICISADAFRMIITANDKELPDANVRIYPHIVPGQGFTVLGRIPYATLGLEEGALGNQIAFNFIRARKARKRMEHSTWAPVTAASKKGFMDTEHYGKMVFGRYQPGQGRYEEVTVPAQ